MRIFKQAAAGALCSFALAIGTALPAHGSLAHPTVVSEDPADTTPHIVLSDTAYDVRAYAQVGPTIYAGGLFSQVQDPAKTTTYTRQNFVAFDAETGVISPLDLSFDGRVGAIEATPDGTAIFIAGAFTRVNGITRRGIMKYDLVNERIDPVFAPTGMRTVHDLKLVNGALIAAGNFTKKVMAMDPTTGADTGAINITVAGVVNPDDETRVRHIAVSPDGTRLVATGNFVTVNGQTRRRAFMLNLGATATLSTWYAPRFAASCPAGGSRREWAQGVDFSPDGSYFVVVTTGGPNGTATGLCDAAARFETTNVSSTVEPTWVNWTGGDTLYSVAITGVAVYVGGHQRWLNNPFGRDSAGAGAVERPGIGAIDPVTGLALPWNPTKSREHGTMVLYATPSGLWVGSDGARFGHEDHAGIGFAPLNAGPTPDTTPPNTFIDSGPSGNVSDTSATFSFSASEPSTFQCRIDGGAFAPCTSPISYTNLSIGSHTFQVAATDGSFNVDATPAERTWTVAEASSELVGNPGFEVDTSGWKGDAAANTLSRAAGGHSGAWAAHVSTTQAGGNCGLDDQPNWVSFTQAGDYTASIWARSDTPGLTLKLRVREYVGGARQGTVTESMPLTSSWQQVTAAYTPVAPGQSSLDYEAFTSNTPAGVCFQADDASITLATTTDTTPPDTFIDSGPSGSVADTSATFSFSASEPSTFQCRVDGGAFAPCASPISYSNLSIGPHTFQVAATDGSDNVDASPAEASWNVVEQSAELVGNPGFEVDTSGWKGDAAANTLSRVAGGHSGGWAAEISTSQSGGNCGLDDKPDWVSVTQNGTYTVTMWARSDAPGRTLKLRVREYAGGAKQGTITENLALTSSWQQVSVVYTPVAAGSSLDVDAFTSNSPVGVCFQADDVSITH
ncbi:MAG TPA: carbohydrate binding domain-containing protein [Actinomycetota bacterium]|nr:carbohydrate binding domain-containing protein [Actinomycetota bacterium]